MSTRRAQVEDAPAIALVHVRSWQATYRGMVPRDYLDRLDPEQRAARWGVRLGELAGDWPRRGVIVAEQAGAVAGFATMGATRDQDLNPAETGEVMAIYLLPGVWGRGLGRELMAAARAALTEAGYREAALWVAEANQRARSFYAADGWQPDGAVKQEEIGGAALTEVRYRRPIGPGRPRAGRTPAARAPGG